MGLQQWFSFLYGTSMFLCKSFVFGIRSSGIVRCWGPVHVMRMPGSEIRLGTNVSIISSSNRCSSSTIFAPTKLKTWSETAKIIIKDNVWLNGTSIVARSKSISIEKGTIIAPNVVMMDSNFHTLSFDRLANPALEEDEDVVIGENVWIGTQSIILKGARIGDNSVIGAGSVVMGEIPPDVLAAGIPAKVIRNLA